MKRTFIIDGNSLANRAFYALPYFNSPKGEPSGAVYGFANLLIKLITEEKPDEIIVAFDHARQTFRNEFYKEYKGTRKETPSELLSQFPIIKEMLQHMGITTLENEGIEADDIIGTLSKKLGDKKILVTGDRDLLQLVNNDTEVWLTKKGLTDIQKVDILKLRKDFGIAPYQVVELKALMGDVSDNIPGVPGVGEKTAQKLIESFGGVDNLYADIDKVTGKLRDKLIEGKDLAYLSKKLATIKTDCDIKYTSSTLRFPFDTPVYNFFKRMGFNSLIKRGNLFEQIDDIEEELKTAKRIKIDNLSRVDELINKIKFQFAISFEKLEFSPSQNEIYYIEQNIGMFQEDIDVDEVLLKLRGVFEDKNIIKITLKSKDDMHKLASLNIKYQNFFDISIARYVLYAGGNLTREDKGINNFFLEKKELIELMERHKVSNIYNQCEIPLVSVLFNMEKYGFRVDKKTLDELDEYFTKVKDDISQEIYDLAGGEFNLASPKQVSEVLFGKLGLTSWNNKKLSTRAEVLEDMIDQHPIIEKILLVRKYNKIISTYIDVYKKLVEEKGNIIHTVFNQTLTTTGRLSSSNPNLQNIPTRDEIGKMLRKLFISKFDGGKIISADYNQIELRLLADMSGEPGLIDAYQNGADIHALTASKIFKVDVKDVTPSQRRDAKAVNFGIIYGISDYGLSQSIKTTRKNAKEYINSYFEKYPMVKSFSEENVNYAKEHGFIRTRFGRIRLIPEINSSNANIRGFAERVAMNMPLQGTASDIIKFAMIKVFEELKGMKSQLILQIHDELIIDVYPGEAERVRDILLKSMQNIVDLKVPLPISLGEGESLYDCKD